MEGAPRRIFVLFLFGLLPAVVAAVFFKESFGPTTLYALQALWTGSAFINTFRKSHFIRFSKAKFISRASIFCLWFADIWYWYFSYVEKIETGTTPLSFLLTSVFYRSAHLLGALFLSGLIEKSESKDFSSPVSRFLSHIFFAIPLLLILVPSCPLLVWPLFQKISVEGLNYGAWSNSLAVITSFLIFHYSLRVLICSRDARALLIAFGFLTIGVTEWAIVYEYIFFGRLDFSFYDLLWYSGILFLSLPLILRSEPAIRPSKYVGRFSLIQNYRLLMFIFLLMPIVFASFLFETQSADPVVFLAIASLIGVAIVLWTSHLLENGINHFAELMQRVLREPVEAVESAQEEARIPIELKQSFVLVARKMLQEERSRNEMKLTAAENVSKLAAQVAHDIRSPLAALEMVMTTLQELPQEARTLLNGIAGRIRTIANHLLENYRPTKTGLAGTNLRLEPLQSLLEEVVSEKRAQYQSRTKVQFKTEFLSESPKAKVDVPQFFRVLSNPIDNAVEALPDEGGVVEILLEQKSSAVFILVKDSGKGIPPERLPQLGGFGVTFDKVGGSGLGLHFVFEAVRTWGGKVSIASELAQGTSITIELPLAIDADSSAASPHF